MREGLTTMLFEKQLENLGLFGILERYERGTVTSQGSLIHSVLLQDAEQGVRSRSSREQDAD